MSVDQSSVSSAVSGEPESSTSNTCCNKTWNYFKEYCSFTEIHGLRFFVEPISIFEKVLWCIVFLVSIGGGIYIFIQVYEDFESEPIIVGYSSRKSAIYTIPFPAVTICPESTTTEKFSYTAVADMMINNSANVHNETKKQFFYQTYFCKNDLNITEDMFSGFRFDYFDNDFYETVDEMKSNFTQTYDSCKFMREKMNCSTTFEPVVTDRGICYTFNMMTRSELFGDEVEFYGQLFKFSNQVAGQWKISKGYNTNSPSTYPRRALYTGSHYALEVLLISSDQDFDYGCNEFTNPGFRVLVHSPVDMPLLSKSYIRVPLDTYVSLTIQPEKTKTSDIVRTFGPHKRGCFLENEKELRFFKIYTQMNCDVECLANFTFAACDCVEFYMPRNKTMNICGLGKRQCILNAAGMCLHSDSYVNNSRVVLTFDEFSSLGDLRKLQIDQEEEEAHSYCGCLPLCDNLDYEVDFSFTKWYDDAYKEKHKHAMPWLENDGIHLSVLTIYFTEQHFMSLERNEFYGWANLIASFGGIFGLFAGISVVSIFDFVYFFTLRIYYNKKVKSNSEQVVE